jgi:predicted chitinase
MRFDRKQFFDSYRASFGAIQQLQVDGLEFLLTKIEADPEWDSLPQIAYFLATIKHETGISRNKIDQTFQPIRELRAKAGTAGRRNQDRYWLSGYYGRGYVQLTWKDNYAKFGLADVPDDALEPNTAYMVAARGMREGKFTKYKLSDFIDDSEVDYHEARRVVNGLDRAEHIAGLAQKFERILRGSLVTNPVIEPAKTEEPKAEVPSEPPVQTVPSEPPVAEIKAQRPCMMTRITAGVAGLGPVLTAAGIKIGNVELSAGAIYALAAVVIVGLICGAWIYNQGQNRALERAKLNVQTLSDKNRLNVVTP